MTYTQIDSMPKSTSADRKLRLAAYVEYLRDQTEECKRALQEVRSGRENPLRPGEMQEGLSGNILTAEYDLDNALYLQEIAERILANWL